jgi:hypothetical protein
MKMAARWRRQPDEQGLARVCQSPRGLQLREKGVVILRVNHLRGGGWYWCGMGQNTCDNAASSMEEAKEQAIKFYKENKVDKGDK